MAKRKKWFVSCAALVCFLLLILLIKTVDVQPIGPEGSRIGLAGLNGWFHRLTGQSSFWYHLTQGLGLIALAAAGVFALLGLYQLIRRKSLFKVDRELLCLGGLYAVVLILYVVFDHVIINYRPVLMPGELAPAASFPSSHTMLVCTVAGSAMLVLNRYIRSRRLLLGLLALCAGVIVLMVLGRLLSGVHWFTDIIGGILLSAALLAIFSTILSAVRTRPEA